MRHRLGLGDGFGHLIGEGDPSAIRAPGRSPAVLALHGFTGTPLEVSLACEVARDLGLATSAPLLPGHGTHARDLAKLQFRHWAEAALDAFDTLEREHERVIVVGLSLGAVLALHVASARRERTLGVALLANACWLTSPFPAWPLALIGALRLPDFAFPKVASDIGDLEARRTNLTYSAQPVRAAVEVLRAGRAAGSMLHEIRCPALILHGARDRVCPVRNAERVARALGSTDKRVVVLPSSHHIITRDVERGTVRTELSAFYEKLARRPVTQTPVEP